MAIVIDAGPTQAGVGFLQNEPLQVQRPDIAEATSTT